MEISIKTLRNDARNGGITAPSGTGGAADNIFESLLYQTCLKCLTMDSYKEAESLMMEVMTMAVKDGKATPLMARMVEDVKLFFIEKNKPQAQNVYQNCTFSNNNSNNSDTNNFNAPVGQNVSHAGTIKTDKK